MTDPTTLEAICAGDVAAALDAAEKHAQVVDTVPDGTLLVVAARNDRQIHQIDLERFEAQPVRPRGTVAVFTADGFVAAYRHRTVEDALHSAVVYANPDTCALVAVLDDDHATQPGWRQHRIRLDLKPTPEWQHWHSGQGLGSQDRFAETIEGGEREIIDPSATVMLDIAQTFHATMGAKVKRHNRLRDGRTQLVYDEDIEATAGSAGELAIPDTFTIRVRPFYGAEPVDVTCRLRYRVDRGGAFAIGYQMDRPDEVRRISFATDVLGQVREQLPDTVLVEGIPATELQPGR